MTTQTQLTRWRFGSTDWIVDNRGEPICEYFGEKANGHLIQSAPVLLRELMKLVAECELAAKDAGDSDTEWLDSARAVILQAGPHRHSVHNTEAEPTALEVVRHGFYEAIVLAVKGGQLAEPFKKSDFRSVTPSFGERNYHTFVMRHTAGNPNGNPELFVRVSHGKFECIRPFKYGL